ncbi:variant erythrocyte surface antigen-1 family protein [Babesia divergens]|uniref:Variant erythrocyte surface antigen-1 family protein n=1 Tax=Babesia divergens TaxID=32595 RepID=A0AAD9GFP7_BABDI|nr:variant erythrocyte surface antigen-1 family protein [Babesia divergens]
MVPARISAFKAFVESVQTVPSLNSQVPQASHGLSKQVQNILKLGSVSEINNISGLKDSFYAFTSAFDKLKGACATKSFDVFTSTPGSTPNNIAEGLYGFLHTGVEGWSESLRKALEKAAENYGKTLKKNDHEKEFNALVFPLKAFFLNLKAEYVLAYSSDSAKWDSLCPKSGSKCCGSSSPPCSCPSNCSPGSSCPKICCEKCPKRLCAKIFLGMLPCLYYALKYLFKQCEKGGAWKGFKFSDKDSSLGRFFIGMGYDLEKLDEKKTGQNILNSLNSHIFNGSTGTFDNIYKEVSENYFKFVSLSSGSTPKSPPSTVRSMLLWLYGLRFQKHFSDLVSHFSALCLPFGNPFNPDAFCYYIHTCCFILPVSFISTVQHSDSHVSTFFSDAQSEILKFSYPEDPFALLETLFLYVRKIYIPLTFFYFQCKNESAHAGWKNCYFGRDCSVFSTSGSSSNPGCGCDGSNTYLCTYSSSNKDVHGQHCDQSASGKCINSGSGSSNSCISSGHNVPKGSKPPSQGSPCKPCPHPLQRFLCDDNTLFQTPQEFLRLDFSQTPPVMLEASQEIFKMGFTKEKLSSTPRVGNSLFPVLKSFCDSGFFPLSRLCEFLLCVTLQPPSSLVELYVFFRRIGEALNSDVFTKEFSNYVDGEPGFYPGRKFAAAVRALYGSESSHWNGNQRNGKHKKDSESPANLYSLVYCNGPKGYSGRTCGPYMYPLLTDAFQIHPTAFTGTYLSWVCYLADDFKKGLKEFKEDFELCSHCKGSSGKCEKIVECPCVSPKLYKYGFIFWRAWVLNCPEHSQHPQGQTGKCTQKSCANFVTQLSLLLGPSAPLSKLIEEIPKFIFHIRFPFFFGFLYVWFFVLSYFCYVILIKLDTFHTGSHLHLPRSFKILPSTLFSDASSKLKDLSYFTL